METNKKPARLSLPRTGLPRVYRIDAKIASGGYPNSDDLARMCETSVSTISRDIEFMRDQLLAPIEYDPLNRGYYYTQKTYRLPAGFTSAEDLLALGMAKNILALYRNTPIYDSAHHLLDSITAPLASEGNSGWYENRIIIPQTPTAPVVPDMWNCIVTALKENRVLTFEYSGANDEDFKPRRVRPYQLLFDTGVWYLYGFAEERKDIRVFSLCRMKNIILTKDHFSLSKDFDYRAGNADSYFGVFAGQKRLRFKIAFYDYSVVWVKDRQWAADQKIAETGEGVTISFTSTQFDKVLEWVLSRGCTARPLEPELLVNEWKSTIDEMKEMAAVK